QGALRAPRRAQAHLASSDSRGNGEEGQRGRLPLSHPRLRLVGTLTLPPATHPRFCDLGFFFSPPGFRRMGLLSGRVTATRYRVAGRAPRAFGLEHLERLATHAIGK